METYDSENSISPLRLYSFYASAVYVYLKVICLDFCWNFVFNKQTETFLIQS